MNRLLPRALMAPAVVTLFLWMIVPLVMTIYFSVIRYNLMQPGQKDFIGLANFEYFVTDPSFGTVGAEHAAAARLGDPITVSSASRWRCWSTSHSRAAASCACC
jgi:ABC-type sugar transport system permease subunit